VRAPQKLVEVDFGNPWTLVVGILTLRWFRKSWAVIDASAEAQRTEEPQEGFDPAPLAALLTGAVLLSMMEYFGHGVVLHQVIDQLAPPGAEPSFFTMLRDSRFPRLLDFAWWSGWRILGFLLIPALVWKVGLGRPLVAAGLQTRGFLSHAWVYAFFFGFVVLLVVGVSFGPQFQQYYPFYREASRSGYDLLAWEILYAAQFFSLEFFFRGFWLESCRRSMGAQAVFVMVVPYCMIHFGKPYPETLGAILAGVMLGTLAMRTRSIWGGFLIHVSIAVSMDVAALLQTRGLPSTWWPFV
jgi:membrane protease YdiL (CAAX protease family)